MTTTTIRNLAGALAFAMAAAIAYGFVGAAEGAAGDLLANAWGRVTVVDLYLALGLGWLWLAWREDGVAVKAGWALGFVVLGSLGLWLYVARTAHRSGDVRTLVLGRHAHAA